MQKYVVPRVCALLLGFLVGCGDSQPTPPSAPQQPASKEQQKQQMIDNAKTWQSITKNDPNNP